MFKLKNVYYRHTLYLPNKINPAHLQIFPKLSINPLHLSLKMFEVNPIYRIIHRGNARLVERDVL